MMNRFFIVIIFLIATVGCATLAPKYTATSEQGKDCLSKCSDKGEISRLSCIGTQGMENFNCNLQILQTFNECNASCPDVRPE